MADLLSTWGEPALKQYYDKAMVESLVYKSRPFFSLIRKKTDFVGDVQKLPLIYGDPQGSSHTFSAAVAHKTNSAMKAFFLSAASNYAVASIANELLEASSNDRGAFIGLLTQQIDGAINTVARRISIQLFRSGSGSIGKMAASVQCSDTVLQLANPDDIVNFEPGAALVSSSTDGSGTVGTTVSYVVAIDRDAGTISVAAAQGGVALSATASTLTANRYVFRAGDYDLAIKGLSAWLPAAVASNDSFFGVNRSADKVRLAGVYQDNSGLSVEEALIKLETRISREGGKPTHCFLNHTDWARLKEELGSKVMYIDLKGGSTGVVSFKGIQLNGSEGLITVLADRDVPSGEAFMLDMSTWYLLSRGEAVRLFTGDGMRVLREVNDDAVTARVVSYAQLGCSAPGFNGRCKLR